MKVEFKDADGGNTINTLEIEDINSYVSFLKNTDKINIYMDNDYYLYGELDELLYQVDYSGDEPEEVLMVFINSFGKK